MKTNSILNLIVSEDEKSYLSNLEFYSSFTKSKTYIFGLYKLRLEISEEITHTYISGLKELLNRLEHVPENQQIAVNIFTSENADCAVFTDDQYTTCYGLVKAAIEL